MRISKLVMLSVVALALFLACSPRKAAPVPAGTMGAAAALGPRVVYFEGDVKVDGSAPEIGKELGAKVRVETGTGASCDIVLGAKNAIRISQDAEATLDFSGIVKEVSLKKGGLSAVLRGLAQVPGSDSFRVTTATAYAGVRGTCFCVWAEEGSTYVCACNGRVRTIDAKGSNELSLEAAHHSAREYTSKGGKTEVVPAGIEHHSDASIESLAARIGETIDWTKED